jgi:hypothetical protein
MSFCLGCTIRRGTFNTLVPSASTQFGDSRFRQGCTFLRVREDKLPKDCLLEQVVEHAAIQNIDAFIEAGLATAGTNR